MRCPRFNMVVLLLSFLFVVNANYQTPTLAKKDPPLTKEQQEKLKERNRLFQEFQQLAKDNKVKESIITLQKAIQINKEVYDTDHPSVDSSISRLASYCEMLGVFDIAKQARVELFERRIRKYGNDDWRTADAKLDLANIEMLRKQSPADLIRLFKATEENREGFRLHQLGRTTEALAKVQAALRVREQLLGEKHPHFALSLSNLAFLYKSQGQSAKAEPLYRKALDIRKEVLGEMHPDYATSLNNLAALYQVQGESTKAEPLFQKALAIRKEVLGEKHLDYGASLNNLAFLYISQGQSAKAEPLFQKALVIFKEVLGAKHPDYALSLSNLAFLYDSQGQAAKAEPLYQQSLDICKEVLGEKHPDYASSLNNLAALYNSQGQSAKAESFYQKALAIRKEVLGEKHPHCADTLSKLALLYESQGQFAKASTLCLNALAIRKEVLGEKHPDYATSLNDLAMLYESQGQFAKAEPLHRKALDIRKEVLGEKHPAYANSLNNLAALYVSQGEYAKTVPLLIQAIQVYRELLNQSATTQTEQQQQVHAQHLRIYIDNLCFAPTGRASDHPLVYAEILAWKGAITARQRSMRQMRTILQQKPDAETTKLFNDLDSVSQQLAALSLAKPDPKKVADLPQRMMALSNRREQLEKDLSGRTEGFRRLRETLQMTHIDLQKMLPEETVLIDFFEYRSHKRKDSLPNLDAFVVTAKTIERVELGKSEPLAEAIDRFRARLKGSPADLDKDDPAAFLRERIWGKLEKYLAGAQVVLISPDGPLHRLPFAALPGKDPKNYLIEETALVVLPVPQLLGELLERRDVPTTARLLALGDVDFDADPGVAKRPENVANLTRAGSSRNWGRLPATEKEVAAIEKTFRASLKEGAVELLRGDKATEASLRAKVEGCHYLHLATHGFFAPKELKAMTASRGDEFLGKEMKLVGYHPGTLSGLVLAGANRPKEDDDGILTALEVGDLNLTKVDLAVLSACETGLGEVAGGEGVLGLQRAFQVAGAKSVITTLWQIPDEPTRILMERFYENLWKGRDGKKFSKLEALREAQLWMLKEGKAHPGIARGLVRDDVPPPTKDGRLPPYYWAAFVLSGDWR